MYLHPWSWIHIHEYIQVHGGQNRILEGWFAGGGISGAYLGGGGGGGPKGGLGTPLHLKNEYKNGRGCQKFRT